MPITAPSIDDLQALLNQGWGFQQHIGDSPTGRFALCRVWHGYIMAAYQSGSKVQVRFYDPYQQMGKNWIGSTINLANQTTATPVALCYLDLSPYLFVVMVSTQVSGGVNGLAFSWAQLPEPPSDPSQSWDLSSVSFSSPHGGGPAGVLYGPSVQPLGSNIAIAYGQATGQGNVATLQAYQLAEFADPMGPVRPPVNQAMVRYNTTNAATNAAISTVCEPTLLQFGESLLCFTVNPQNFIEVTNLQEGTASTVTTTTLQTDVAPAVTVDPTGTMLIVAYKQPGSGGKPLMFTSSGDGVTFAAPQNLKTGSQQQATKSAPAMLALNTGQILLAFQSGSGNGSYSVCPSKLWTQPNGLNVVPAS
jgi:hypothetical protein